jgi:hypothetical protein
MSSRNTLKHTVSTTTPPTNGTLGDEWFNPASNRLYKLVANSGTTVSWYEVGSGVAGSGASTTLTVKEDTNLYFTTARVLSALSTGSIAGNINFAGNIIANTVVSGNASLAGNISSTANININTGDTLNVAGNISSTGNVTASNFIATATGAGTISSTSDITLSAGGNVYITANNFIRLLGNVAVTQLPVVNTGATAYSLSSADAGKILLHTLDATGRTWTIPTGLPVGSYFVFVNDGSAGAITVTSTSDTLALANTALVGNRTLAANGIAQLYKITNTKWFITGNGIS